MSAIIKRVLLDIDSPTRSQIKKAWERERARKACEGRLINTAGQPIKPCGGCGRAYSDQEAIFYYGELFCVTCVEMWTQGGGE